MVWVLAGAAAAAECEEPKRAADVASALDEALVNFALLEEEAFQAALAKALADLDCVREPVSPELAAELHRVRGIGLLVAGDAAGARASLVASARIEPGHTLSTTIAPAGGPLATAWADAKIAGPGTRAPLGEPVKARVDGSPDAERPLEGPYVLQVSDPLGAVVWSGYVPDGWPALPPGLAAPAPAPAPAPVAVAPVPAPTPAPAPAAPAPASKGGGKGFLVAGVAAGAVAAGLYGTAVVSRLGYEADPTQGAYGFTNGAWAASIGTAAVSAGLLTVHVATR